MKFVFLKNVHLLFTQTWLQIPTRPLVSSVTMEMLLTLSEPQFLHIQNEDTSEFFIRQL